MKAYIVYSIHKHLELVFKYNICVHLDKDQAEEHARLANQWNENYYSLVASHMTLQQLADVRNGNPYDKHDTSRYGKYKVEVIDLIRHVDEYQDLC